ncbi:MAG: DUF4167 domain-containing protein [Alphaproteobacteria bacterium]|nr:DUF4167 domain-containing protein [Alphaproteobacteria bacterium]
MRQNQKNRFNARHNNRGHRPQMIFRNTALDSNGPCGKLHGTALQLFEKYQVAAKDAQIQNDAILAETCLQYADHYMRLQNQAIANEEAARQQNTPKKQEHKQQVITDELPDFPAPQNTEENSSKINTIEEEIDPLDEIVKNMDLSVPVLEIQEKHSEQKSQQKTRTRQSRTKKAENIS